MILRRVTGDLLIRQWRALETVNRTAASHLTQRSSQQSIQHRGLADVSAMSEQEMLEQIRAGIAPATGRSLKDVAAEVWGHNRDPVGPGHRSGQKILRRPLKGPLYASWYPPSLSSIPANPIRLTEKQERWQKKLKTLRAAGKGPPKKGAGKRSK